MIISHRYRFIFVKTLKTAGTSIEVYLSGVCGEGDVVTPIDPPVEGHEPRNYQGRFNPIPELVQGRATGVKATARSLWQGHRFRNHLPAFKARARLPPEIWEGYTTFCVERNPWDKTLSHYHMVRKRQDPDLTLDAYLDRGRLCLNFPYYTAPGRPGAPIVDRVLRYDRLNDELAALFAELGVPFAGELGVSAKGGYRTDRRPYQEVLTATQRHRITSAFQTEIDMHGFEFWPQGRTNELFTS